MAQTRQTNPDERPAEQPSQEPAGRNEEMRTRPDQALSQAGDEARREGARYEQWWRDHAAAPERAMNMTATTLRSVGQLYDMQAATTRIVMRAQARAFSAMGLPDYSHLFQIADDRSRRLFSTTTDTLLQSSHHANQTAGEIQQHLGRLWEQQTMDLTETWRQSLQELQNQATASLNELKELVRQQADELAQATESLTETTRQTLREGGEQFRATMREGFDRSRDLTSQAAEASRRQGENVADAARHTGEDVRGEIARPEGERSGRNRVA